MSGVELSGVEISGDELSGVEMSTFGMKIGHFNPRLYNRIYCVIPGVEMSPTPNYSGSPLKWATITYISASLEFPV